MNLISWYFCKYCISKHCITVSHLLVLTLQVIELPVKHPELFEALGIAQPKGVLLYGPPGTGKTLLARAVAHHTECTFIRVSGSELVQKFIGEGSRMVRELFVLARYFYSKSTLIIIISLYNIFLMNDIIHLKLPCKTQTYYLKKNKS